MTGGKIIPLEEEVNDISTKKTLTGKTITVDGKAGVVSDKLKAKMQLEEGFALPDYKMSHKALCSREDTTFEKALGGKIISLDEETSGESENSKTKKQLEDGPTLSDHKLQMESTKKNLIDKTIPLKGEAGGMNDNKKLSDATGISSDTVRESERGVAVRCAGGASEFVNLLRRCVAVTVLLLC